MKIKLVERRQLAVSRNTIDSDGVIWCEVRYPDRVIQPKNLSQSISEQYGLHRRSARYICSGLDMVFDRYGEEKFALLNDVTISCFPGEFVFQKKELSASKPYGDDVFIVFEVGDDIDDVYLEEGEGLIVEFDRLTHRASVRVSLLEDESHLAWIADDLAVVTDSEGGFVGFELFEVCVSND